MGVALGTFVKLLLGESPRKNVLGKKLKCETNVGKTLCNPNTRVGLF
jgi:hypothetical protein